MDALGWPGERPGREPSLTTKRRNPLGDKIHHLLGRFAELLGCGEERLVSVELFRGVPIFSIAPFEVGDPHEFIEHLFGYRVVNLVVEFQMLALEE